MERPGGYAERLNEYMRRELHPETAENIGRIVATSELMSAEGAMSIILQMQLDHLRRDADMVAQTQTYEPPELRRVDL